VVSPFPAATVDLALVVDEEVPVGALAGSLREGAGALLESLRMFDLYSGPQVGEGRKSVAFAMRLRAPDRTLTADEVAAVRDAAVAEAAGRHGAELRR
jgi:phenylalanyl-tRNA synthetase beta chain